MKYFSIVMLLLCLAFSVQAAVYKHVDEHGNLIKYSDEPQKPGDKPMDLPKPSTSSGSDAPPPPKFVPPSRTETSKEPTKPVTAYIAVTILKPDNEQAIRANGGVFPIELASQPALDAAAGHRYIIVVDGEKHQESREAKFDLQNMNRGAHSISAQIRDSSGKILTSSSSITVYVLRASVR